MIRAIAAVAALLLAAVAYYVDDLIKRRKQLDGLVRLTLADRLNAAYDYLHTPLPATPQIARATLPQPPMQNKLVGHLHIAGELVKIFPDGVHAQVWADYIRTKWNLPEVFYFDLRPFGPLTLYIADPVAASQYVTTGQSLPKGSYATSYIQKFLGVNNMVTLEGAHWKSLRTIFNPGFSLTNIMGLADVIVDASLTFCDTIKRKAESGELFELEALLTGLTIEVIGKVVLDTDTNAQTQRHPITTLFRERSRLMPPSDAVFPWQAVDLLRPYKLWRNGTKLDHEISKELDLKIQRRAKASKEEEESGKRAVKKRSVVDLAIDAYEKEISATQNLDFKLLEPKDMPDSFRADITDSVKTFIFAGHDTTSSTLCWATYLLHKHPGAYAKVQEELDTHLPASLADTAVKIKEDPYIVNKLEYTTAVIKETMRIFPSASTTRAPVPGGYVVDPATQQKISMIDDNCHVWPVAHMVHRNQRFFPRPTEFIPERFIQSRTPFPDAELFTEAGRDAWRPFEKGPRNCIGQELAMLEGRIILALTAREFDFVLEYPGEEADVRHPVPENTVEELSEQTEYGRAIRAGTKKPDRVEGHRVYQMLLGAAKPADGCPGRVYYRQK